MCVGCAIRPSRWPGLVGAAAGLGPKLGPVLLQLPPTLKADPDTLDACLMEFRTAAAALGGEHGLRVAVEPRHETWWTDEIRQILAAHDASAVLGRPARPPDHTAVVHRDVGLSAVPRGHGPAVAQLRPAGAEVLGGSADGDLAG